jgi:C1A family cysteine protease
MDYEPSNLAQIQSAIQQANAKWKAEETWLSELSPQEKQMRLGAEPPAGELTWDEREKTARANFLEGIGIKAIGAPVSYDLSNINGKNFITPITNQSSCGSCVAFGSLAAVEGTMRVKRNDPDFQVNLSEAHLFYCHAATQGRNCDNGWWVDPALEACKNIGVADEDCYPYTPGNQQCKACSDWQNRVTKISSWSKLTTAADMKTWLSTKGPVAACFKVYDDFYAYRSGIYSHVTGNFLGGHCVCTIGYNDTDGYWICKNSWGDKWGEKGFFRIAYGDCGIDSTMWGVEVVAVTPGGVWLEKKQITGLWSINEERNAFAYVDAVGWLKISAESDSIFLGMLELLASAKESKSTVNLRVENNVIKEIYVF